MTPKYDYYGNYIRNFLELKAVRANLQSQRIRMYTTYFIDCVTFTGDYKTHQSSAIYRSFLRKYENANIRVNFLYILIDKRQQFYVYMCSICVVDIRCDSWWLQTVAQRSTSAGEALQSALVSPLSWHVVCGETQSRGTSMAEYNEG